MRDDKTTTHKNERQGKRKANAAVKYSLANGQEIRVGRTVYVGKNPVFIRHQPEVGGPVQYLKAEKGIPFVRANKNA